MQQNSESLYNKTDKVSILNYAKKLQGRSLVHACNEGVLLHGYSGKGNFGQILEKFYFQYLPNSDSEPDFPIAGIELKSSPLKELRNKDYRSKERLVLNIINYFDIAKQEFKTSSFWKKNAHLLLVFYLHKGDTNFLDFIIKLVDEWTFPETDLEIIKKDWEFIKNKVSAGKAHELSVGDTFYLGACTKGGKGGNPRAQPFSSIRAKQRAFSLKQGYVNHIIASIYKGSSRNYGKLIPSVEIARKLSIEDIVISKFASYWNKTIQQILNDIGVTLKPTAKNYYALVVKAILGVSIDKEIEEFEKANIDFKTIKVIRVEENNKIKESISFPAFKFENIYHESWDTSELKERVENKMLFVFLKRHGKEYQLDKVKFWNMPFSDRNEVRKVWLKAKKVIQSGVIVKGEKIEKSGRIIRLNYFPKKSESKVAHVRPHGKNAKDTYPLPVTEKKVGVNEFTKQCFWFNWDYVGDEIYLK